MSDRRPHTESELIEFVRSIDAPAPESLRLQLASMLADAPRRPRLLGVGRPGGLARRAIGSPVRLSAAGASLAAILVVAITLLASGGSSGPSLRQAAALTLGAPTLAPPSESVAKRDELGTSVDGVSFPYWEGRLGWRSTGARSDRVSGRAIQTVFYADRRGRQVGYAIVAGTPAPRLSGGVIAWRNGTPYRLVRENGALAVGWLRGGRLCVISGRGVDAATLLALASSGGRRPLAS